MKRIAQIALVLLIASAPLAAKTLTLTDEDADKMAQISEQTQRHSWGAYEVATGVYADYTIDLIPNRAFLFRIPLDQIPPGQRITRAELTVPIALTSNEQKINVRRILGNWGPGVSWLYREVRPKKVEWTVPGGKNGGKDRVTTPSATAKIKGPGDAVFNLTEDVELWYSGAATNNGWMMTVDEPEGFVRTTSPAWSVAGTWKLRITYEPK